MVIVGSTAPALEQHLGYWLRFVSNHVSFAFRDRIAKLQITVAEWVVLRSLFDQPPSSLNALAERIGKDASTVSRLIDRLVQRRLVVRAVAPRDRRAVLLSLSPSGCKLVPKLAKEADANDSRFFDPLSQRDKAHLRRIMQKLVRHHHLTEKPTE